MKAPSIRYRVRTVEGGLPPGAIIMGVGRKVRRAYRVLSIARVRTGMPMLGITTWRVWYEPMSVQRGRDEIATGAPHWPIYWDRRKKAA